MPLEASPWSAEPITRVFAGLSIGRRSRRLKIALLRCRGEGWSLRCAAIDALTVPAASEDPTSQSACDAISSLAGRCGIPISAIDLLGLADGAAGPGSLCAAWVADRLGVTVVDGFSLRDQAAGGAGGPLSPVCDWLLFRSARLSRLLIHLGPSLTVTLLPAGFSPFDTVCFDAGPCGEFLDHLARELSQGQFPFDPSGHFAVQGRQCDELLTQWKSHPYLLRPPPKFVSPRDFSGSFSESSLSFARELRLSARDLLCSANVFVVHTLEEALRRFLPRAPFDEVWVSGGGAKNGLLWKLLQQCVADRPVGRIDEHGVPGETRDAAHAALLAYCTLENLPANVPAITGAERPLVLGRITPGNAENWDQLVLNLADRFELESKLAA